MAAEAATQEISFTEVLASADKINHAKSPAEEAKAEAEATEILHEFRRLHGDCQVSVMIPIGGVLAGPDGEFEATTFGSFAPDYDWSEAWSLVYELEELAEEAREWWPRPGEPDRDDHPSWIAKTVRKVLRPVSEASRVDSERRRHSEAAFGLTTWVFLALREEGVRHTGASKEPSTIFRQKMAQIRLQLRRARHQMAMGMQRSAQIKYWYGAMRGAGCLAVLCALIGASFLIFDAPAFYGVAFAAGGIGAMVSVLQRMSTGRLKLDTSASRGLLELFGGVRPFIGAVFGIMIAAGLFGSIIPAIEIPSSNKLAFFAAIGFLAGFNERWAQDMLKSSTAGLQPMPVADKEEPVPAISTDLLGTGPKEPVPNPGP